MKPKIIALYLPQFHRVPENDEWWGEGFTDWIAVKNAKPLVPNHNQPRIPLNHNYYDLTERKVMEWQSKLMDEYCIDAMCFYHYWFKDGKRILEKPAENLLQWKDIDMPFCFCWANESWKRTWSKMVNGNTWSSLYETDNNPDGKGILLEQDYGDKPEWEEHLQYLLDFFRDERYIKFDGKPVFVIYQPNNNTVLFRMIRYWNRRIRDFGFEGIYFIGMEENAIGTDAVCKRQPNHAIQSYIWDNQLNCCELIQYPYEEIWKRVIYESYIDKNKEIMACAFVDYDTTPRMGDKGQIMNGVDVEVFKKYFHILYEESVSRGDKAIFINAWNEWGEGNYLEPDMKNKFQFLEAVRQTVLNRNKGSLVIENINFDNIKSVNITQNALRTHDNLLEKWMCLRDEHIELSDFFKEKKLMKIGIYGMGRLGNHLLCELSASGIKVEYGIDKVPKEHPRVKVYSLDDELPEVDAIVITVMGQYDDIAKLLDKKIQTELVTIEEVINFQYDS
jgi:hypothetical protein